MAIESDSQGQGAAGGWRVEPDQVRAFAAKVDAVRALLGQVRSAAAELAAERPRLGTSPVGQGLSDKFADRAGPAGLGGQVDELLTQVDDFVQGAEETAARYQATDSAAASTFTAP